MDIQAYETLITTQLNELLGNIINTNPKLNIAVKKGERVGDGISKFLENRFVEFTQNHQYFKESLASPEGKTKNPFDVQTFFEINNHRELLWIDFKAINIDNDDTNPDSGTPDKVLTLMNSGYFYLVYILVYYKGNETGLDFVKNNEIFVKSYFLKDVSSTMRITPANQMQVNGFAEPMYRTREEFLEFLLQKKIESNERKLKKATEELENLRQGNFKKDLSLEQLKELNKSQEESIKNL
ncbi:hypothetical protein LV89_00849 [Arcicella aurantiaca]|uniref:Uncharacterized protein n=1 Tax=Arcicella aurantiaca TaxID=591202 RepID=A0A316EGQ0_9BACT|nr:hypothetical protein [Arcicella aurantiaca]PWK28644.1 hypothetical protein LV89_00849 [Arcicella aurantiaca]